MKFFSQLYIQYSHKGVHYKRGQPQQFMVPSHLSKDETTTTSPPQLCARHDQGGGVHLGTTFAIYSTAQLPQFWQNELQENSLFLPRLLSLASLVKVTIPILTSRDDQQLATLISLPCPSVQGNLTERKPWFLLNARRATDHCIIGEGSITETLLTVLRRPWCVLELCCCSVETLNALLMFASVAKEIDARGYAAAVLLLAHEKQKRTTVSDGYLRSKLRPGFHETSVTFKRLRDVCSAVFTASTHSYNSFWLGLICACAINMDIAFSTLIVELVDESDTVCILAPSDPQKRSQSAPKGDALPGPILFESVIPTSRLTRSLSSVVRTNLERRQITGDKTSGSSNANIISIYLQILQQLSDLK